MLCELCTRSHFAMHFSSRHARTQNEIIFEWEYSLSAFASRQTLGDSHKSQFSVILHSIAPQNCELPRCTRDSRCMNYLIRWANSLPEYGGRGMVRRKNLQQSDKFCSRIEFVGLADGVEFRVSYHVASDHIVCRNSLKAVIQFWVISSVAAANVEVSCEPRRGTIPRFGRSVEATSLPRVTRLHRELIKLHFPNVVNNVIKNNYNSTHSLRLIHTHSAHTHFTWHFCERFIRSTSHRSGGALSSTSPRPRRHNMKSNAQRSSGRFSMKLLFIIRQFMSALVGHAHWLDCFRHHDKKKWNKMTSFHFEESEQKMCAATHTARQFRLFTIIVAISFVR